MIVLNGCRGRITRCSTRRASARQPGRFFLVIEAADPRFNSTDTRVSAGLHAQEVVAVDE
jgi:hypothetical protein